MSLFYFPDYDCVFIHIPKTAGFSIRDGFFEGKHDRVRFGAVPPEWAGKFKFTFVRNPYDRAVSCWKMFTSGMENTKWAYPEDGNPALTFKQFLEIARDDSILYDQRRRTFEEKLRHHAIPQTHPFNCLDQADFTGRFETLREDFAKVCARIGATGTLPHMNKTDHAGYRAYYDDETRQMVASIYAEDLERLGYSF